MLIFPYKLSSKTKYILSFLINLQHNKIMCFNVSMGDHAIFKEHKVQKFNYNPYDDIKTY
jgi:hypothetical protein